MDKFNELRNKYPEVVDNTMEVSRIYYGKRNTRRST